jgi:hypothetical protein
VLHERLLAPRVLHFGRKQLFWECSELCACEAYPNGLPPAIQRGDTKRIMEGKKQVFEEKVRVFERDKQLLTKNQLITSNLVIDTLPENKKRNDINEKEARGRLLRFLSKVVQPILGDKNLAKNRKDKKEEIILVPSLHPWSYYIGLRGKKMVGEEEVRVWYSIVEAYTKASLTVTSDKLPALSGIAKYFQPIFGDTYLAGIWRDHIQISLGWYCTGRLLPRPEEFRAPTWSWASTDNRVTIMEHKNPTPKLRVLDAQTKLATLDPTGSVSSGFLLVEGPLNRVTVRGDGVYIDDGTKLDSTHVYFDEPWLGTSIAGFTLPLDEYVNKEVKIINWVSEEHEVRCLRFLFLKISSTHPGRYIRLGLGYSEGDRYSKNEWEKLTHVQNAHDALCEEFLSRERGHRLKII